VLLPAMGLAFVDKQIAAIEDAPPQIEVNQGGIIINPPVGGNPAPPIVFNPPPPPVPKLDPRNADDGKEALTRMKNGGPEIDEAFRWLRGADLNHPLRRDFAKQMEMMVDQEKTKNNDLFFEAYFRWANSEDNFDSLMRLVKDTEFTVWQNARRQNAMKTLGRLKEARAADAITQRLGNVFDRGAAIEGMTKMGPAGVPTLLKYMHDPEGEQRNQVRELLKRMDVSNEQLFTQTLTDLKSTDDRVQNAAVEWLSEARAIDEKRRPEVSRALDPMITPQTLQQGPFFKALERWGTKENGLTIAKNLDGGNVFKTADALKLLGKLKDPRTLPVLASRLGVFGFEGNAAKDALRQFGADAEPEVCKVLLSPDQRTRHEACQLLGDIGTAKISGAAMQRACNAYPQDRQLDTHAKRSWLKIKARGG
jgi:HEAT repeat protein